MLLLQLIGKTVQEKTFFWYSTSPLSKAEGKTFNLVQFRSWLGEAGGKRKRRRRRRRRKGQLFRWRFSFAQNTAEGEGGGGEQNGTKLGLVPIREGGEKREEV